MFDPISYAQPGGPVTVEVGPARPDEVQAGQDDLERTRQRELEQSRADIQGSFWSQLALSKASQEAGNSLMFLGEWQKTVNGNIEASATAQADGIPAPQMSSGVENGFLFETEDKEDNWTAIGNILGNGSCC